MMGHDRYALLTMPVSLLALSACSGLGNAVGAGAAPETTTMPTVPQLTAACPQLAAAELPVSGVTISLAKIIEATATTPQHCQIDGEINRRTGIDGQSYAIRFRLRMPTEGWNQRFYMGGGGGTNGTVVDPVARLAAGYATIGTDGGHDNATNSDPAAGGTAAFGRDPQARVDFAYNAYDQVTRVGKALVARFYTHAPARSYYVGCSEGGREGLLMTQRFPEHYDGVIAGDPVLRLPLGPLSGIYTTQLFAGLATRSGLIHADGSPAINKTYSDADLMLFRQAVLDACDGLDGLPDGIVDNQPACTGSLVGSKLSALICTGAKTDTCLSADQVSTMQKAYAGTLTSQGVQLYVDWQWDAGIGGRSGNNYNPSWRSWWLGAYASASNNATKLAFASAEAVAYTTPPQLVATSQSLAYSLAYNFDTDPIRLYTSAAPFTHSAAELYFANSPFLGRFHDRGGKVMVYHGASDSSVSVNDTLNWYHAVQTQMGPDTASFARLFVVPGMAHCSGGPATDSFDMLPQLVDWVEKGVAPDKVTATASNPGYFGVASRSRPLCSYPKQARYNGSGDINDAANFSCR